MPLISAAQLLEWTDGRNNSSFGNLGWNSATGELRFSIAKASGANGLEAMLPKTSAAGGDLTLVTGPSGTVSTSNRTVKGIEYVVFSAKAGSWTAKYDTPVLPGTAMIGPEATPEMTSEAPAAGADDLVSPAPLQATDPPSATGTDGADMSTPSRTPSETATDASGDATPSDTPTASPPSPIVSTEPSEEPSTAEPPGASDTPLG